jgi:hypothetical protein
MDIRQVSAAITPSIKAIPFVLCWFWGWPCLSGTATHHRTDRLPWECCTLQTAMCTCDDALQKKNCLEEDFLFCFARYKLNEPQNITALAALIRATLATTLLLM